MTPRRLLAALVIVSLALVPVVGFAWDDLSASPIDKHQRTRQHEPSPRGWRTVPATLTLPALAPALRLVERVAAPAPARRLPLLVRLPFVPPRG